METITLAGKQVRVVRVEGEIWWVAADVAECLGYAHDAGNVTRYMEPDEKGLRIVQTPGGPQEMVCVTLAGLAILAGRTRTPEAREVHRQLLAGFTGMVAEAEKLATAVAPAPAPLVPASPQTMARAELPWDPNEPALRGRIQSLLEDMAASKATRGLLPMSVYRIAQMLTANQHQVFGIVVRMAQEGMVFVDQGGQRGGVRVGLPHEPEEEPGDLAMAVVAMLRVRCMTTAQLAKGLGRPATKIKACLAALEATATVAKGKDGWVVLATAPTQRRGKA